MELAPRIVPGNEIVADNPAPLVGRGKVARLENVAVNGDEVIREARHISKLIVSVLFEVG